MKRLILLTLLVFSIVSTSSFANEDFLSGYLQKWSGSCSLSSSSSASPVYHCTLGTVLVVTYGVGNPVIIPPTPEPNLDAATSEQRIKSTTHSKSYAQLNINNNGQYLCKNKGSLWTCQASSSQTMEEYIIRNRCTCE